MACNARAVCAAAVRWETAAVVMRIVRAEWRCGRWMAIGSRMAVKAVKDG